MRMLLLANLEAGRNGRDLPAAEQEAVDLMGLAARHPEGLRVVRKSPTTAADLRTLMDEGFDVVHFASHASHGRDGRVGWVLPNGQTVMPGEAGGSSPPAPIFVFSNSCSSGPTTELAESRVRDVAASFMTWGVPAYLGTLWELHDAGSAAFAVAFYRALLSGATLAGAVSRARESLMGAHPITWANYVLYGDPALTLAPRTGRPRE